MKLKYLSRLYNNLIFPFLALLLVHYDVFERGETIMSKEFFLFLIIQILMTITLILFSNFIERTFLNFMEINDEAFKRTISLTRNILVSMLILLFSGLFERLSLYGQWSLKIRETERIVSILDCKNINEAKKYMKEAISYDIKDLRFIEYTTNLNKKIESLEFCFEN